MASDQDKGLLYRTILILAFPWLRVAYAIYDVICFLFQQLCRCIGRILRLLYRITETFLQATVRAGEQLGWLGPAISYRQLRSERRKKLQQQHQHEPLPYENEFWRRFLTHSGGILLGLALYIFVYIVLVKHHTLVSVSLAFLLMLPYLLVLENSHSIRAIMLLCLPIMFTNRGRALVFCCMLAIMVAGPLRNSQANITELHKSLNCSKQYMILRTDDYVEKNVVNRLMRIEQIIELLVQDIKQFAQQIRQQVEAIVQLALKLDQYIRLAIEELKRLVDICNSRTTQEATDNCHRAASRAHWECKSTLGAALGSIFCAILKPLGQSYCDSVSWPEKFCDISRQVILYIESRLRERLLAIEQSIKNLLYVDVDIEHSYSFNGTKSKSFRRVWSEIRFDVARKFWYIHWVLRVFNLVTLVLVIWITLTATLYHMHYMHDIGYDNMYLDRRLLALDEHRKRRLADRKRTSKEVAAAARKAGTGTGTGNKLTRMQLDGEASYSTIYPLTEKHQQQYLKPFGVWMNEMERHKLLIAGLVWLIIVNYIGFFVALDFGLYHLIELINQILEEILFKSDLPLIDVSSRSSVASGKHQVVHYNRTYLSQLRQRNRERFSGTNLSHSNSSMRGVSGMYRRLMDSVERNIPDDVMILDSLEQCLPKSSRPNYRNYKKLALLAALTFGGVILEAYALRLRHWIANLFYPRRADKRTLWLYRKILAEKAKFDEQGADYKAPELKVAEVLGKAIASGKK